MGCWLNLMRENSGVEARFFENSLRIETLNGVRSVFQRESEEFWDSRALVSPRGRPMTWGGLVRHPWPRFSHSSKPLFLDTAMVSSTDKPGLSDNTGASFGGEIAKYRNYLRLLACAEVSPTLRHRIDPSDIVQQTLLEAEQCKRQYHGHSEAELTKWLRRILGNNVKDAQKALFCQKREISREVPLNQSLDQSSRRLDVFLASQTTPSQQAIRCEELIRLSNAIFSLPDDQRDAIILHHLKSLKLAEVAEAMSRSQSSVAGLLQRGLKRLRGTLRESDQ